MIDVDLDIDTANTPRGMNVPVSLADPQVPYGTRHVSEGWTLTHLGLQASAPPRSAARAHVLQAA